MYRLMVTFEPTRVTPVARGATKARIPGMWSPTPKAQGTDIMAVATTYG